MPVIHRKRVKHYGLPGQMWISGDSQRLDLVKFSRMPWFGVGEVDAESVIIACIPGAKIVSGLAALHVRTDEREYSHIRGTTFSLICRAPGIPGAKIVSGLVALHVCTDEISTSHPWHGTLLDLPGI